MESIRYLLLLDMTVALTLDYALVFPRILYPSAEVAVPFLDSYFSSPKAGLSGSILDYIPAPGFG